jgi:hypothetical protein
LTLALEPAEIFRNVFKEIFFPYLAADLARLRGALQADPRAGSSLAIPLTGFDPARRAAYVSGSPRRDYAPHTIRRHRTIQDFR